MKRKNMLLDLMLPLCMICATSRATEPEPNPTDLRDFPRVMTPDSVKPIGSPLESTLPQSPLFDPDATTTPSGDSVSFAPIKSLEWYPGMSRLFSWGSGSITASGGRRTMPGLMGIENGSISMAQRFGNFTIAAHADAVKYGFYRGLHTSYGFGGSLTYDFNEKLSMTVFGSYYTKTGMKQPAMAGYVNVPRWGGFIDYKFHDRWGVKVGAQAYHTVMGGDVEAQPIVMPYYRLGNGAELGVDLGGILYQIVRGINDRRHSRHFNPTMGPPRPGPPPVR